MTEAFEAAGHSEEAQAMLKTYLVGQYIGTDIPMAQQQENNFVSSPLIDTERALALLLGLHASYQVSCIRKSVVYSCGKFESQTLEHHFYIFYCYKCAIIYPSSILVIG